jgi:hypothetical protein
LISAAESSQSALFRFIIPSVSLAALKGKTREAREKDDRSMLIILALVGAIFRRGNNPDGQPAGRPAIRRSVFMADKRRFAVN